ncbi:hypothetical protein A3841_12375 [Pontibacter flavimaris]|uniref:Uncharacterized protein n=1 Tax=Pontibacter flavimaris TaxID=1797110 RepID=A0A1Q5PER5_9BACT|nr:hypothetical protein A3841_12375 [Pontibacter flavimaris]
MTKAAAIETDYSLCSEDDHHPPAPFKGGLWLKLRQPQLSKLIPAFGLSAYASFSGAERSEVLRRRSKGKAPSAMPEGEPSRA